MRVVLAAVGSRGDVQPMLALAQALAARGHVPVLAVPPNFEPWVRGLRFAFAPLGLDTQAFLAQNPGVITGKPWQMLGAITSYFKTQVPEQVDQLRLACADADAMVYGGLAFFAAPGIAERLQLPALGVLYSACLLPSALHPPPTIAWQGLPGWVNEWLWRIDQRLGDWLLRGAVNAIRIRLALEPVRHVRAHLVDKHPLLLATDETLFPPDLRQMRHDPYVNFLMFDDPKLLDPALHTWLDEGEAPIFIGFGSMSGPGTKRIDQLLADVALALGRRGILDAGWAGLGANSVPRHWRVVRDAPHAALFARCAVIVHHGGSGTTAQALRAGVPQVVLPHMLDQFYHAHRLHLAGLAAPPLPMVSVTAARLRDAIEAALALPVGPLQVAAHRLRASHAGADIVQRVENMVGGQAHRYAGHACADK